jgi:hypothetical protein
LPVPALASSSRIPGARLKPLASKAARVMA